MSARSDEAPVRIIEAEINYVCRDSKINRRWVSPGFDINTGTYEAHTVGIRDGRPLKDGFRLDEHGFALVPHRSAVRDFDDKAQVDAVYPAEAQRVLLALTGADHFAPLGWIIRGSDAIAGGPIQPPGAEAHVDLSPDRAPARAKAVYEKAFPGGRGFSRCLATSYWRCLSAPPQDWPLAVCESTSIAPDEGTPNTMFVVDEMPDEQTRMAEMPDEDNAPAASIFHYSPAHRWWYFPDMTRDEVLVFKLYDSNHACAWRTPHTAFHDPSYANAVTRRSIEFRSIVFFD